MEKLVKNMVKKLADFSNSEIAKTIDSLIDMKMGTHTSIVISAELVLLVFRNLISAARDQVSNAFLITLSTYF